MPDAEDPEFSMTGVKARLEKEGARSMDISVDDKINLI